LHLCSPRHNNSPHCKGPSTPRSCGPSCCRRFPRGTTSSSSRCPHYTCPAHTMLEAPTSTDTRSLQGTAYTPWSPPRSKSPRASAHTTTHSCRPASRGTCRRRKPRPSHLSSRRRKSSRARTSLRMRALANQ
jgi:hypothetical protein